MFFELKLGFFPIWSAFLAGLAGICLVISLAGLVCHSLGLRNPRFQLKRHIDKARKYDIEQKIHLDELISMNYVETNSNVYIDRTYEPDANVNDVLNYSENQTSKLMMPSGQTLSSSETTSATFIHSKKHKEKRNRFMKDHL
jgi:uncharacterized protein (DUF58 family)